MSRIEQRRKLLAEANPTEFFEVHEVALCAVRTMPDGERDFVDVNSPDLPGHAALIVAAVNDYAALLEIAEATTREYCGILNGPERKQAEQAVREALAKWESLP